MEDYHFTINMHDVRAIMPKNRNGIDTVEIRKESNSGNPLLAFNFDPALSKPEFDKFSWNMSQLLEGSMDAAMQHSIDPRKIAIMLKHIPYRITGLSEKDQQDMLKITQKKPNSNANSAD